MTLSFQTISSFSSIKSAYSEPIITHLFLFSLTGCNCHISGSEDRVCDSKTGQCKCRPHVIGRTCDRCDRAYWNLDSKKGCLPCACSINGSEHQNCDSHSGQCLCKSGVEGVSCDRCRPGYFGFSPTGCKREF